MKELDIFHPYKERNEKENVQKFRIKSQKYQKKDLFKKNGLYSKEDSSALKSDNENYSKNDSDEYLLMAFGADSKKQNIIDSEEDEEVGVVDFEGELINALDELKKAKKNKRQLKKQLQRAKEVMHNSDNEEFVYQKEKIEEVIKSKDSLALIPKEKQGTCEKLEEENKQLKWDLFKLNKETISKTCKDGIMSLKVKPEEVK